MAAAARNIAAAFDAFCKISIISSGDPTAHDHPAIPLSSPFGPRARTPERFGGQLPDFSFDAGLPLGWVMSAFCK
jgi:hypothetical protein